MPSPLISAVALAEALESDRPPVVLDARWQLGRSDGHELFLAAHIPGARYVDLDTQLADPPSATRGRHPLPATSDFQATLRALGVREGDEVVGYDAAQGFAAARLWWMLRDAGIAARVLDGGLRAWSQAGLPTAAGEPDAAEPGDVVLVEGRMPTLDIDETAAFPATGVLLDARAGERYRGEQEPVDPRAGHIPGAVSAPTAGNLDDDRFLPPETLRERFAAIGIRGAGGADGAEPPRSGTPAHDAAPPVGVYCGSGITAAHEVLALEVAGIRAALFPGSWSQWSADPDRPVAIGARPE